MTKKIERYTKKFRDRYLLRADIGKYQHADVVNRLGELEDKETPLEPKMRNIPPHGFREFICGNCQDFLLPDFNYCPSCGQRMLREKQLLEGDTDGGH